MYFDAEDYYAEWESERRLKKVEKEIRAAGDRLEWRLERVWALDDESTAEERATYEETIKLVGGYPINPRCLDDYVTRAYGLMETIGMHDDNPDWKLRKTDPESVAVHEEALDWARAGVVVLPAEPALAVHRRAALGRQRQQAGAPSPVRLCAADRCSIAEAGQAALPGHAVHEPQRQHGRQ